MDHLDKYCRGRPIYLLKANRYQYIGIGISSIGIGIIGNSIYLLEKIIGIG